MDWFSKYSPHCLLIVTILFKLAMSGAGQGDGVHQFNQGGQDNSNNNNEKIGPPSNLMRDMAHIQDKDHILEHLDGMIDVDGINPEEEMTEKELQLYYFRLHDYDHNGKLDGLELINAMTHYHHDGSPDAEPLSEEDLMGLIDPIFRDDDKNKDGYIDYPEYAATTEKS